jgi:hypothetical protein
VEDTKKMMEDIADNFHDVEEVSKALSKDLSLDAVADASLFDDELLERELEAVMSAINERDFPRRQHRQESVPEDEDDLEIERLKASMPGAPKRAFAVATTTTTPTPSSRRAPVPVATGPPVSSVDYLQAASDALFK